MKKVDGWNHIILEGFCCRTYSCKKDKYVNEFYIDDKKDLKTKRVKNPCYDSKYKTPKKPKYCKDRIGQDCYFRNCPHLGIGEVPEDDLKKIHKKIGEIYDES